MGELVHAGDAPQDFSHGAFKQSLTCTSRNSFTCLDVIRVCDVSRLDLALDVHTEERRHTADDHAADTADYPADCGAGAGGDSRTSRSATDGPGFTTSPDQAHVGEALCQHLWDNVAKQGASGFAVVAAIPVVLYIVKIGPVFVTLCVFSLLLFKLVQALL